MADGTHPGGDVGSNGDQRQESEASEAADLQALARDWITLWQSELAAMAADRELQEGWQASLAFWAGAASAIAAGLSRQASGERAAGHARAAAAPGAAPAAAAPDPRDAEIERLGSRIGELEQRLAGIERGVRAGGVAGRGGARKRRR